MRRLVKPRYVKLNAHENLYLEMEKIRKQFQTNGINLSQVELTNLISKRIRPIKNINILGVKNVKKKR